ncbi:M1 family aminopeptidase [Algoriphagus sp.]|uniref:M1 family aminopeptidase n=1 Tax=Algoriphagus sp. TaxID=1872435 RepID=UPI003F72B87C
MAIPAIFLLLTTAACKTGQVPDQERNEMPVNEVALNADGADSVTYQGLVSKKEAAIRNYNPTARRDFDVLHTALDLSFDYSRQAVIGKAELTIIPYFYPAEVLVLDAQDFEFNGIFFTQNGSKEPIAYTYDEQQLRLQLPRLLTRKDTFRISLDYVAFPERNSGGGSAAISDTKGLYFIDPLDTVPGKPRMIWTQGETAHNSKWFPTIDAPNEKFTQLVKLTLPDTLVSIGNGELVRQEMLEDGMRKDHWEMKLPHSAYLAAFAIGDFGKVEADWEGVPLGYYVEKGYEKGAEKVFKNTPEMIGFFSETLGVRYPWPKYDQVVVRDFVSGAMENTTVSIFMEELRLSEREAIDSEWDYIIAHELFHQWFGDYVTNESWSNLTLNEAFANYSEFLWNEYKYGEDEAKLKLVVEMENYFSEAETKQVDLIRFDYDDAEDMFDSHSYSKGGVILHMLREHLGKEAFYSALQHYLQTNAFSTVEVHDLRMAFERVSGEDLNWFFNQWFLAKGHPELYFEVDYSDRKNILISVSQRQDLTETPLYQLPLQVSWYEEEQRKVREFMITKASQEFVLSSDTPIPLVLIDEEKNLLAKKYIKMDAGQMVQQFRSSESGIARYEALDSLAVWGAEEELTTILPEALKDGFWAIRESALTVLQGSSDWLEETPELSAKVIMMATHDERNSVRAGAIDVLSVYSPDEHFPLFKQLANDSSYLVAGSALMGLVNSTSPEKSEALESYVGESNFRMVIPIADYYISDSVRGKGSWFMDKAQAISAEGMYYFLGYFGEYFSRYPEEGEKEAVKYLLEIMQNDSKSFLRLGAFQALLGFSDNAETLKKISDVAGLEKDKELLVYYNYFLESLGDEN